MHLTRNHWPLNTSNWKQMSLSHKKPVDWNNNHELNPRSLSLIFESESIVNTLDALIRRHDEILVTDAQVQALSTVVLLHLQHVQPMMQSITVPLPPLGQQPLLSIGEDSALDLESQHPLNRLVQFLREEHGQNVRSFGNISQLALHWRGYHQTLVQVCRDQSYAATRTDHKVGDDDDLMVGCLIHVLGVDRFRSEYLKGQLFAWHTQYKAKRKRFRQAFVMPLQALQEGRCNMR